MLSLVVFPPQKLNPEKSLRNVQNLYQNFLKIPQKY